MNLESKAAAIGAAGSGVATTLAVARDIALELLGVPLPVVLGALTGACGARFFMAAVGFWRALAITTLWMVAGSIGAQFVLWVVSAFVDKPVPAGALAGVALIIAAGGPFAWPVLIERGPLALRRWIDSIKGGPHG